MAESWFEIQCCVSPPPPHQREFSVEELAFIKLDKNFSSRVELRPNPSRLTLSFVASRVFKMLTSIKNCIAIHTYITGKSVSVTKLSLVSTKMVYHRECAWFALLVEKFSMYSDYTTLLPEYKYLISGRDRYVRIHSAQNVSGAPTLPPKDY